MRLVLSPAPYSYTVTVDWPGASIWYKNAMSSLLSRMQPIDMLLPIECGSFVP